MSKPLDEIILEQLGMLFFQNLSRKSGFDANFRLNLGELDFSFLTEAQQKPILAGISAGVEMFIANRAEREYVPFPYLMALYQAGVAVPLDFLQSQIHLPQVTDKNNELAIKHNLEHLQWIHFIASNPDQDTETGYNEWKIRDLNDEQRARVLANKDYAYRRPLAIKTSPAFHNDVTAIANQKWFQQFIKTAIAGVEKLIGKEKEELINWGYIRPEIQRPILSGLWDARFLAYLEQGLSSSDYVSSSPIHTQNNLDDLAFFDTLFEKEKAASWKFEFAYRVAEDSLPQKKSRVWLEQLCTTPELLEEYGAKLLTVNKFNNGTKLEAAVSAAEDFFNKSIALRKERGEKGKPLFFKAQELQRAIADQAIKDGNLKVAQQLYEKYSIIQTNDPVAFNQELIRVSDLMVQEIIERKTGNNPIHIDHSLTSKIIQLYTQAYANKKIPPATLDTVFTAIGNSLYTETFDKFFVVNFETLEAVPKQMLAVAMNNQLSSGNLTKAEQYAAVAGITISAEEITKRAFLMSDYDTKTKNQKKAYFERAEELRNRKLTFREFFDGVIERSYTKKSDLKENDLKDLTRKALEYAAFIDVETDKYDFEKPAFLPIDPKTYRELIFHYTFNESESSTNLINSIIQFSNTFSVTAEDSLGFYLESCKPTKDNPRKLSRFVKLMKSFQAKDKGRDNDDSNAEPTPIDPLKEQKELLYGIALERTIDLLVTDCVNYLSDDHSGDIKKLFTERIAYEQKKAAVTVVIDGKKERDEEQKKKKPKIDIYDFAAIYKAALEERSEDITASIAIKDKLLFDYTVKLAEKGLELLIAVKEVAAKEKSIKVTPANGADQVNEKDEMRVAEDLNKRYTTLSSVYEMVSNLIQKIDAVPSCISQQEENIKLFDFKTKANIETIVSFLSAALQDDIKYHGHDYSNSAWQLLTLMQLEKTPEVVKNAIRSHYKTLVANRQYTKAKEEIQKIGEFSRQKAYTFAREALYHSDLKVASEFFSLAANWDDSLKSAQAAVESNQSEFGIYSLISASSRSAARLHIPSEEIVAAINRRFSEARKTNEVSKIISFEDNLTSAGYRQSREGEAPQPIQSPAGAYELFIQRYLKANDWQQLSYLHERRPNLAIPEKVLRYFKGKLPVETMSVGEITHASKLLPDYFKTVDNTKEALAQSKSSADTEWLSSIVNLDSLPTKEAYQNGFVQYFSRERFDNYLYFTSDEKGKNLAKKILDDKQFLEQKLTENNPKSLKLLAMAAIITQYDYSQNQTVAKVLANQEIMIYTLAEKYLSSTVEDCIDSRHRPYNEQTKNAVTLFRYLGNETLAQFVEQYILNFDPCNKNYSAADGGIFKSNGDSSANNRTTSSLALFTSKSEDTTRSTGAPLDTSLDTPSQKSL